MRGLLRTLLLLLVSLGALADQGDTLRGLLQSGRLNEAQQVVDRWLKDDPGNDEARAWAARLRLWQGDVDGAARLAEALLSRHPRDADLLLLMAQVRLAQGDPRDALRLLDEVHERAPAYTDAWRLHLQALQRLGRTREYDALLDTLRRRFPRERWPAPPPPRLDVRMHGERQWLDRGWAPWSRLSVLIGRDRGERRMRLGYASESRFDLRDDEFSLHGERRLGMWRLQGELRYSPTHQVLPHWLGRVGMGRPFADRYTLALGFSHRRYSISQVDALDLSLECYFASGWLAYHLTATRLMVGAGALSHRMGMGRQMGDHWRLGGDVWGGQELEYVPLAGVLRSEVLGTGAWAERRLGAWRLRVDGWWHRQGQRYTRKGVGLGIARRL